MKEIAPGIWHWVVTHPRIKVPVSSYYLPEERVVIDPLAPGEGLDFFEEHGAPTDVLLTNRHHYRSSGDFVARFGSTVRCVREGMHEYTHDLNRFEGWHLYSSARISQLMGNSILTFLSDKNQLQRFFGNDCAAYFSDFDDLVKKVRLFQSDDVLRQQTAAKGQSFYREHFSGQRVSQYIVETTMGLPYSHDYLWQDEIYR